MFSFLKKAASAVVRGVKRAQEAVTALVVTAMVGTASLLTTQPAQAQSMPDASAQLSQISTSIGGYATVMFLIAITAVGILVGVKWIKRGRGAA